MARPQGKKLIRFKTHWLCSLYFLPPKVLWTVRRQFRAALSPNDLTDIPKHAFAKLLMLAFHFSLVAWLWGAKTLTFVSFATTTCLASAFIWTTTRNMRPVL